MSEDYAAIIAAEFRGIGLDLSELAQRKLTGYCKELEHWNQSINLTSLHGSTLVRRLILEPAWIATELKISGTVIDIGSGNGSPAVPIVCCRAVESLHLIEVRARRAAFLRHLCAVLAFKNAQVHRSRFEDAVDAVPIADWVTLQAVMPDAGLLAAIRRIAKPSTTVVWITSEHSATERFPQSERRKVPFGNTTAVLLQI